MNTSKPASSPLIDYLVLSEFDINAGSIVRCQYPSSVPQVEPGTIASYMLPEGAHNRPSDTTYFALNRPSKVNTDKLCDQDPQSYIIGKFFTSERMDGLRALIQKNKNIYQA